MLWWSIGVIWVAGFLYLQIVSIGDSYQQLGLLDTQVYRMGGQAILDGSPLYEAVYPRDSLEFTYSPFAAMAFVPLAGAGWTGAAVLMTLASLAATLRVCQIVVRRVGTARSPWLPPLGVLAVLVALALWPVRSTLEYGQVNLLIMWLVVEDLLGAGSKRRWSGLLLGLAIGIKLTPFVFLGLLLWSRQFRRLAIACTTAVATVLVGFVVQPPQAWLYWSDKLFETSRVGDMAFVANQSLAGVIARVVGRPVTLLWVVGAVLVFVLTGRLGATLWARERPAEAITAVALGGLLISPISWSHHWTWLLVAAVVLAVPDLHESTSTRRTRLVLLASTVACGSFRIQTLLSPGAEPWVSPNAADWLIGNNFVMLAIGILGFLGARARRLSGAGPVASTTRPTMPSAATGATSS